MASDRYHRASQRQSTRAETAPARTSAGTLGTPGKQTLTQNLPAATADPLARFRQACKAATDCIAALEAALATKDRPAIAHGEARLRYTLDYATAMLRALSEHAASRAETSTAATELQALEALAAPVLARVTAHRQAPIVDGEASLVAAESPRASAPAASPAHGDAAWKYVEQNRPLIFASIAERLSHVGLVQPHARLRWVADSPAVAAVAGAIRAYVEAAPGLALKRMMALSYPADLAVAVDRARNGRTGAAWLPEVGRAVAEAFDEPIVASIQRMGLRLRVQLDGDAHGAMLRGADLVASCPLDGVIADVLVTPGLVASQAKHGGANDTAGRPFADGVREVEYEWLGARDPELWNWIHVTAPKGATAEHVAHTPLSGGEVMDGSEQAYRIAASPPYFGIPIETARLVPEAWNYAPAHLKTAARANDPGPRIADGSVLATSAVADEAALAQAGPSARGDLASERALERASVQLAFLQQKLAPWHAHLALGGAQAFLGRRGDEAKRDPRALHRWAPVLVAAERILYAAASEATALIGDLERHGGKPEDAGALGPAVHVIQAYAHAGGVAHLGAEAPAALAEARRLRAMLPLALAEDRIRVARGAVAEQQAAQRQAGRVEDRAGETTAALPDLATRAADLRLHAARGEAVDLDTADQLAVDADETALRAQILAFQTQLTTARRRADAVHLAIENQGGWTVQKTTAHLHAEATSWLAQLDRTSDLHRSYGSSSRLGSRRERIEGARRTVAAVRHEMVFFQNKAEVAEFLAWAYQRIADKQLQDALCSMALQIGLMLATSEIAGAAVAAVRGAALVRNAKLAGELIADVRKVRLGYQALEVTAQAYLMTQAQRLVGGPSGATAFTENLAGMALTTAALAPFEGLFGDAATLEQELQTWAGSAKAAAKLAVKAPIEIGAGIAASAVAQAMIHGGELTTAGADDVVTQGISFVASKFVHRHTIQMRERIERAVSGSDRAEAAALLQQIEALSRRAEAAAGRPSAETTRTLLADHAQLLHQELQLYDKLPGAAANQARAQNAAARAALGGQFAEVPFRLAGLRPVVDGAIFEGTAAQIRSAFVIAEHSGVPLQHAQDPQTGVWRVSSGERSFQIREFGSPHAGPASAPAFAPDAHGVTPGTHGTTAPDAHGTTAPDAHGTTAPDAHGTTAPDAHGATVSDPHVIGAPETLALPREEIPEQLAEHQRRGARVTTAAAASATGGKTYDVEYPNGRRIQVREVNSPEPRRPGAGHSAPFPQQASHARAVADRAAKIQERRDHQLTALINAAHAPLIADTIILGAGQGGTLTYATLGAAGGAPPGIDVTEIPKVFNIAPEGSMFARHGDFPMGQAPGELRGPPTIRQPGEFTSAHDAPITASDYVRSLTMTAYDAGMVTYKASVTEVQARPAGGWGEGVAPEHKDMPIRVTAGGKTIYARRFISAGGLGAPAPAGRPGTPLAAHEPALRAANRLVYAQESLTLPGGGHTIAVVGNGATGAWACEAAIKKGATKIYWIGASPKPGIQVSPETRKQLTELGLTQPQIETYVRAYNNRNAPTFRYIDNKTIELRTGLADATLDASTGRVKATLSDGSPLEIDGIVVAIGQKLSLPAGISTDTMEFRMVVVNYQGTKRLVALDAFEPGSGRPLGIRIEGAQMAKAAPFVQRSQQKKFTELITKQIDSFTVPTGSRGVIGSIYQSNIDIPLANSIPVAGATK